MHFWLDWCDYSFALWDNFHQFTPKWQQKRSENKHFLRYFDTTFWVDDFFFSVSSKKTCDFFNSWCVMVYSYTITCDVFTHIATNKCQRTWMRWMGIYNTLTVERNTHEINANVFGGSEARVLLIVDHVSTIYTSISMYVRFQHYNISTGSHTVVLDVQWNCYRCDLFVLYYPLDAQHKSMHAFRKRCHESMISQDDFMRSIW